MESQQNQNTQTENAVLVFLIQHGHQLNQLHATLRSNSIAHGLKVFLSVVLQILCYVLFAFAIYMAIMIPSDFSSLMDMMSEDRERLIDFTLNIPQLNDFLLGMKIFIAVISLPVLICAILLGRNRRKSMRLRKAFRELEVLKGNFDATMQTIKF